MSRFGMIGEDDHSEDELSPDDRSRRSGGGGGPQSHSRQAPPRGHHQQQQWGQGQGGHARHGQQQQQQYNTRPFAQQQRGPPEYEGARNSQGFAASARRSDGGGNGRRSSSTVVPPHGGRRNSSDRIPTARYAGNQQQHAPSRRDSGRHTDVDESDVEHQPRGRRSDLASRDRTRHGSSVPHGKERRRSLDAGDDPDVENDPVTDDDDDNIPQHGVGMASTVSRDQARKMDEARSRYNASTKVDSLRTEFSALQNTVNYTMTGVQTSIQQLVGRLASIDKRMAAVEKESGGGGGAVSEAVISDIKHVLQKVNDSTLWFWGKVLAAQVDMWPVQKGADEPRPVPNDQTVLVKAGTWLLLHYPMRRFQDDAGSCIFIMTQMIDPDTAHITNYWVRTYDLGEDRPLVGEFRFQPLPPVPTVLPHQQQQQHEAVGIPTGRAASIPTRRAVAQAPAAIPKKHVPVSRFVPRSVVDPGGTYVPGGAHGSATKHAHQQQQQQTKDHTPQAHSPQHPNQAARTQQDSSDEEGGDTDDEKAKAAAAAEFTVS